MMTAIEELQAKLDESEESRMELLRLLNEETSGIAFMGEPVLPKRADVSEMVNRFLGWPLPKTFAPDCGVSFKPLSHPNGWPVGTNLLTAVEAKTMFEHCCPAAPVAAPAPSEWISVDERLPADETPVLVFRAGQIQVGAVFLEHESWEEGGRTIRYWDDPHDDGKVWDDVDYWMPLPDEPTPDPFAGIAADFASEAMLTEREASQ